MQVNGSENTFCYDSSPLYFCLRIFRSVSCPLVVTYYVGATTQEALELWGRRAQGERRSSRNTIATQEGNTSQMVRGRRTWPPITRDQSISRTQNNYPRSNTVVGAKCLQSRGTTQRGCFKGTCEGDALGVTVLSLNTRERTCTALTSAGAKLGLLRVLPSQHRQHPFPAPALQARA